MYKPNNYENTSTGEYTPVDPGGHHLIIRKVEESRSRNTGKEMLIVYVDMAQNDSQPGYMSDLYRSDTRAEKKWPHAGTIYITTTDKDGNCSRSLKRFITCFEKSNNVQAIWGDGQQFANQFALKKIGGVYGRVQEEYQGERKMKTLLRWFCEDSKADSATVPDDKMLPTDTVTTAPPGFVQVDMSEEELPFD